MHIVYLRDEDHKPGRDWDLSNRFDYALRNMIGDIDITGFEFKYVGMFNDPPLLYMLADDDSVSKAREMVKTNKKFDAPVYVFPSFERIA